MHTLDAETFARHLRQLWTPAGFLVSELTDAPYKELVAARDGWSFRVSVAIGSNPDCRARVGIWFRPAPRGGISDLAALRTQYQQKLAQLGRPARITNCGLPMGSVFLFFESTAPVKESAVAQWVGLCEELSALAFDAEALDGLLEIAE